jgi:hypothetical protein
VGFSQEQGLGWSARSFGHFRQQCLRWDNMQIFIQTGLLSFLIIL